MWFVWVLALWVLLATPYGVAQPQISAIASESLNAAVERYVGDVCERFQIPGVAIGVVKEGRVIYLKGHGFRDRERKLPVTPETLFPLCSLTKAFTSFVVVQLVQEGKIGLDDPVVRYIPQLHLKDQQLTQKLTIRDLLTHQSGLPRHDLLWYSTYYPGYIPPNQLQSAAAYLAQAGFLERLQHLEPTHALREKMIYNNWIYALLGLVIERVTGMSWESAVQSRLLDRLNMPTTGFARGSESSNNYALPYADRPALGSKAQSQANGAVERIDLLDLSVVGASGGMHSTVAEMMPWCQLHLAKGKYQGVHMLDRNHFNELVSLQVANIESTTIAQSVEHCLGYGLGWFVGDFRGERILFHGGSCAGFFNYFALLPDQNLGIVILSNSSHSSGHGVRALAYCILDHLMRRTDADWIELNAIAFQEGLLAKRAQYEKRVALRKVGTKPSHPLKDYVGTYEHPGYGAFRVSLEQDSLHVRYYRLEYGLFHWHDDTFAVASYGSDPLLASSDFCFIQDRNCISEMHVRVEPALGPVVFKKKPRK